MSINLIIGDKKNTQDMLCLSSYDRRNLLSKSLSKRPLFIDAISLDLDKKELEWIIKNNIRQNVYLLIAKETNVSKKMRNKCLSIENNTILNDKKKFNIMDTLSLIVSNPNRDNVLSILKEEKPPIELIMRFLLSNIDKFSKEN